MLFTQVLWAASCYHFHLSCLKSNIITSKNFPGQPEKVSITTTILYHSVIIQSTYNPSKIELIFSHVYFLPTPNPELQYNFLEDSDQSTISTAWFQWLEYCS